LGRVSYVSGGKEFYADSKRKVDMVSYVAGGTKIDKNCTAPLPYKTIQR
jgi:hypothetical protein